MAKEILRVMQCFCYTPRGLKLKLTPNYSLDTVLQNTFAEETLFAYSEVIKTLMF